MLCGLIVCGFSQTGGVCCVVYLSVDFLKLVEYVVWSMYICIVACGNCAIWCDVLCSLYIVCSCLWIFSNMLVELSLEFSRICMFY